MTIVCMTLNEPIIESQAVEPFLKNGYLLSCPFTKQSAYIDPGDEADLILDRIDKLGLQLQAIIATHAHLDHICGIWKVREKWPVPIFLHPDDLRIYERLPNQAEWFGLKYEPAPSVTHNLSESEPLRIGELELRVHHTPGHSPGHVVVEVGNDQGVDLAGGGHHAVRAEVAPLADRGIKPYLIDQASGAKVIVPNPPKVGPLRTTQAPQAGRQ